MTDTSNVTELKPVMSMDEIAQSMIQQVEPEPERKKVRRKTRPKSTAPVLENSLEDSSGSLVDEGAGDDVILSVAPAPEPLTTDGESEEPPEEQEVEETHPAAPEEEATLLDEWSDFTGDSERVESADTDASEDEAEGEPAPTPTLSDDTMISVKVDGEDKSFTLGELKKRASGEGAIEKRLQEATEAKKVAIQQVERNRNQLTNVLQVVGGMLFKSTVPPPDPSIAQSDPGKFLAQQQAHQAELDTLNTQKNQLGAALAQADEQEKAAIAEMRQSESVKLREALPVLNDPVKGPKVKKAILSAAKEIYGFSDVDIAAAADHRIFVMAADAMRYRKMIAKTKATPTLEAVRTIKPRGGSNRPRISSVVKVEKKKMAKARKTGNIDDIAATMIVPKGRTRRRG